MTDLGPVVDNPTASRFELSVDGQMAVAEYQIAGTMIVFTHTEVPPSLEGRGVGSALARGALDAARERGLSIFPLCPFMESYVRRHREYLDLVNPSIRRRLE
ncbi:MAG TPA: GNAT family N-acetyltransferase [Thermomicrobiales bacterium]|nr:GNAT family N-acetyltransferase [Thermomicrobiales bacterium]